MKETDTARRMSKGEMVRRFRTEEILSAAQDVIGRRGIHGASLERIAAKAGVAKGTIYLYFDSKEDLLCRVLESWHMSLLKAMEEAGSKNGSSRQRLHAVVLAHLDFMGRHRDLAKSYFLEGFMASRKTPPGVARKLRGMQKRCEEIITGIIQDGMNSGEFRPLNARGAASLLLEMINGKHLRAVVEKDGADPAERASELLDLYFYGVTR